MMKTKLKPKRWLLGIGAILLFLTIGITLRVNRPTDKSQTCQEYYSGQEKLPFAPLAWCQSGEYFRWKSSLPQNASFESLNIFHTCHGNPDNPAILLIHGYPTSSYDFAGLTQRLEDEFYVCALDTPGYGFSDKPRNGYDYSIFDDARLVDFYIREVAGLKEFSLLTHDKGDSVGLALLQIYQAYAAKPYIIRHHFITNGNIYLPLAQLTRGQKLLLNPLSGSVLSALMGGSEMAAGMADTTYTPALPASEVEALVSIFDYKGGTKVQHDIIQYLDERKANEVTWLESLGRSDIPTTLIWGELDAIAPTAVPDFVWTNYLQARAVPATYWRIPCANHYLQVDQPGMVAEIIRATLLPASAPLQTLGTGCQPFKVK
jgi:pimeloyl-ACP methyl ester carboxylesterase